MKLSQTYKKSKTTSLKKQTPIHETSQTSSKEVEPKTKDADGCNHRYKRPTTTSSTHTSRHCQEPAKLVSFNNKERKVKSIYTSIPLPQLTLLQNISSKICTPINKVFINTKFFNKKYKKNIKRNQQLFKSKRKKTINKKTKIRNKSKNKPYIQNLKHIEI